MNLIRRIPILIMLLLVIHKACPETLYFRHYNNKDGLSHNTVYTSIQDKRGFMWFGTDDGLNRFDGHTFNVYRYNSFDENSILNDCIISLFEDSEGRIWVCTNKGVCFYDYQQDSFYPFRLQPEQQQADFFRQVREDRQHNLWFINHDRIVRYSLADHSYQIYPANEHFHPIAITLTEEGYPMFADSEAIYLYHGSSDSFSRIQLLSPEEIRSQTIIETILEASDIGIFVGTNNNGLKLYYYQSHRIETVVPDTQIRDIIPYNKHTYWIASESGIYIYNLLDKSLVNLKKSLTNEYALADNAVYSLTRDNEGGIWAGSFFGGISYLAKRYTPFNYYIGGKTHTEMKGNAVREICPDQYGTLWLGTEDNGINHYDPKTGNMTNFSFNNPAHPLSATNIHGLLAVGDQLWIGTYNKGIDVIHIPSGRIMKRYTRDNTHQGLASDFVVCLYKTSRGELFAGTSSGVSLFQPSADSFGAWKDIHTLIRQIFEDKWGDLWFATAQGVYRYIRNEDRLEHYTSDTNNNQTIGSNNVTSVFEDSMGRIWVTTVYGLSLFSKETQSFNRVTAEDGLPSNIVYRIVEDGYGYFWITTANGLVRFNPETNVMRTFTYSDGVPETQFNYSSAYQAPDGTIYLGTINGMISFNPSTFKEDHFVPPVYITQLKIADKKSNTYKSIPIQTVKQLKLPYNGATFSLSFVALSYTSPEAIQYAYKLENIDQEWIYMGNKKDVTFSNLSPGKYLFKVKSTNSSGVWQDNEYVFPILITPPFWLTGWAFIVYALLAGAFIFLFYDYKKKRLEEKHRLNRERFEAKKEKELYDAKMQFFTFITHEIRTPLTLIKAPLEKILISGDGTPETKENLDTIERNTARLLNLSNQLLDFRKTESKGFKLLYSNTDIPVWIRTILQPFLPVIEHKKKTIAVDIPAESFYADVDREALSKIISNMLTNAIKYSDKTIQLHVQQNQTNQTFSVTVINDGPLIPVEEREHVFTPFYRRTESIHQEGSGIGLSLAKSLAEFHNGNLVCTQTQENENCFVLTLPITQQADNLIGTKQQSESAEKRQFTPHQPRILIVEDQEEMRLFLKKEFSSAYQVFEAEDGKEALEILENNPVDIIISDVMMPNMDGFELCNIVKNKVDFSHIPFILLTAQHNLQSHLKGLNQGADAYMEKPFSVDLLTAQVRNLLKNRELLNKAYKEKPLTEIGTLSTSPADDIFLKKLTECIDRNITNVNLGVDLIAAELGMSNSSLYRKVKGISGVPPVEFIKIARLKKAVQLMQAGETRVNEIAFQAGFSSSSYFSTSFLKQYGKTPSEFIKNKE